MSSTAVGDTANPKPGSFSDFLNPHSMMTPGALGALAMLGTNSFISQFHSVDPKYVVLLLSFLFGLAAIVKEGTLPARALFYMLNSIIIFSVAAGANTVGQKTVAGLDLSPISAAYAQTNGPQQSNSFFKPWFSIPKAVLDVPKTVPDAMKSVPDAQAGIWYVVVGSYSTQAEAQTAADQINATFPGKYNASATPSRTNQSWAVHIGTDGALSDAVVLKDSADLDKLTGDSFIQKKAN